MKIEEKYKLEKYIKENGSEVNVYFDIDRQTIWMSQKEISLLVNKSKSTINEHIKKLYDNEEKYVSEFGFSESWNKEKYFNLNVVFKIIDKYDFKECDNFKTWVLRHLEKSFRENKINKKYEIVEFNDENISLDVNVDYEHDTVWLNRRQIALLFNVSVDNVSFHIKNILACGELDNTSVYEDSSATGFDGKTYKIYMYNFDMILSIGYRVNSKRGILFRKWASSVLKKYSFNGYAINEKRCLDCQSSIIHLNNEVNELKDKTELMIDSINKLSKVEEIFKEKIFYENQIFEGYSFVVNLFNKAKQEIIIIDPYVSIKVLDMLIDVNVSITIIKNDRAMLHNKDIELFSLKHDIKLITDNRYHDRFVIIDDDIYHFGGSLKDIGNKITTVIKTSFDKKTVLKLFIQKEKIS